MNNSKTFEVASGKVLILNIRAEHDLIHLENGFPVVLEVCHDHVYGPEPVLHRVHLLDLQHIQLLVQLSVQVVVDCMAKPWRLDIPGS